MIYLVSKQQELFESDLYKIIGVDESLSLLSQCPILQFDTETDCTESRIGKLLSMQFGNEEKDIQIVVDCSTISPKQYKNILESKLLVGHNLKFDLQWLYNYGIVPRMVYDTMIIEQLLYLGYPRGVKKYSLKDVAYERLNVNIDKSIRGDIIWRGLDADVVIYAANDVKYLEKIRLSQIEECNKKDCIKGAILENAFTPAIAYLEWCGIKLDEEKWMKKMQKDSANLVARKKILDEHIINKGLSQFYFIDRQGSLFDGFDLTPKVTVNWDSGSQVVKVCKALGFNTTTVDKTTGQDKDSVLEKNISIQKGIDDIFLKLYFDYKESSKVCSTYGQSHLNAINPITGRIHTVFRALGATSGRMSSGSTIPNTALAKLKKLSPKECTYPNLQQLPSDHDTRSSFVAEKGNKIVACDYSAKSNYSH